MKKLSLLVCVLLCLVFVSCKQEVKKSYTGIVGWPVTTLTEAELYTHCFLYGPDTSAENDNPVICIVPAGTELTILDQLDVSLKVQYIDENKKKKEGWIFTRRIEISDEVYEHSIVPCLNGNEDSSLLISQIGSLTPEEAVKRTQFIFDFLGKERISEIKKGDTTSKNRYFLGVLDTIFDKTELKDDFVTNPYHVLASCATKEILEWAESRTAAGRLKNFYDSDGLSCLMRAVKAENYEAAEYFYYNSSDLDHKDKNGNSLAYYIDNCKNEQIKDLLSIAMTDVSSLVSECKAYLRKNQDIQDFKTIHLMCDEIPYTAWKEDNPDCETAFVFMKDSRKYIEFKENLNVRDMARSDGKIVGKLPYGTKVKVLERSLDTMEIDGMNDFWYKVQHKNTEGWVFGGFLVNPLKVEHVHFSPNPQRDVRGSYVSRCWMEQMPFEKKQVATVVEKSSVILPDGTSFTVKPLDTVEIIEILADDEDNNLFEYDSDAQKINRYYWYYTRYNYYLVKAKGKNPGILSGSHLAHEKMPIAPEFDHMTAPDPESDYYVSYKSELGAGYKTYYADLYEHRIKSGDVRKLHEVEGVDDKPLYIGTFGSNKAKPEIELFDYLDFYMEKEKLFGLILVSLTDSFKYGENTVYNCLFVEEKSGWAYSALQKTGYRYRAKDIEVDTSMDRSYLEITPEDYDFDTIVSPCVYFERYGQDYEGRDFTHTEYYKLNYYEPGFYKLGMYRETYEDHLPER